MAEPAYTLFSKRQLGTDQIELADIPDATLTAAKLVSQTITGAAQSLGLGAIWSPLNIAEGMVDGYHLDVNVNVVSSSRDIAYTDQADLLSCTSSPTVTLIGSIATSTSVGWQLGMGCVVVNADAGTTTIAAGSGQTLTAPNGATLVGSGATGLLWRLGTNSWVLIKVAPVTDRYSIYVSCGAYNPVDAQTDYWGISAAYQPTTSAAARRVVVPRAGTITAAVIQSTQTVVGSNEAWPMYLRLNNTTDYLIESVSSASASRTWTNAALSIAVVAGDYFEIKEICPTWATNPTSVGLSGTILVTAS